MEIHTGLDSLPDPRLKDSIVTWGVFDGVHRGHRKVLEKLVAWAREKNVPSVAVTFDRHPAEVLSTADVPLVTTLAQRLRLIGECGVNHLVLITFTKEFARTTAEEFVRKIVSEGIGAAGVLLGHDSQFGKDRVGNLEMLRKVGEEVGLEVRHTEPEQHGGKPMSSSLIRDAIAKGRLEEAEELLGRRVALSGTIVRGDDRGKTIGFPTANLRLHHRIRPPHGVYAVEAEVEGKKFKGVANHGTRPTFHEKEEAVLEVHLLDYTGGELYGKDMEVRLLFRVRDEKKFSGADDLKRQIADDISSVRARFEAQGN